MAGDWIKMRADIAEDPAVIGIAARLGLDEFSVVGRLQALWSWADGQSRDGHARGVTAEWVNRKVQCDNFAQAMCHFGWLKVDDDGITIPNFDHHNGETAKTRALGTKRKQKQRAGAETSDEGASEEAGMSRGDRDKSETREEKRREEDSSSLRSEEKPRKARVSPKLEITLREYLEACKADGVKPVPVDHPIRAYCDDVGITDEMRQVAWLVFKERHLTPPKGKRAKKYTDWPGAFSNSVKDRWYKLWYPNAEGAAEWSPDGIQQRRLIATRHEREQEAEHAPA